MLGYVDLITFMMTVFQSQMYIGMVPECLRTHGILRVITLQYVDLKYLKAVNIPNVLCMRECAL